jgi:hypothetical protein
VRFLSSALCGWWLLVDRRVQGVSATPLIWVGVVDGCAGVLA